MAGGPSSALKAAPARTPAVPVGEIQRDQAAGVDDREQRAGVGEGRAAARHAAERAEPPRRSGRTPGQHRARLGGHERALGARRSRAPVARSAISARARTLPSAASSTSERPQGRHEPAVVEREGRHVGVAPPEAEGDGEAHAPGGREPDGDAGRGDQREGAVAREHGGRERRAVADAHAPALPAVRAELDDLAGPSA